MKDKLLLDGNVITGIAQKKAEWQFYQEKIQGKEWYISDKSIDELDRDRWRNPPKSEEEVKIQEIQDFCTPKKLLSKYYDILEQVNQDFPPRNRRGNVNKRDEVDNYNIALAIACDFILVTGDGRKFEKAKKYEAEGKIKSIITHHRGTRSSSRMSTKSRKGRKRITY